jgi:hypothetical protein
MVTQCLWSVCRSNHDTICKYLHISACIMRLMKGWDLSSIIWYRCLHPCLCCPCCSTFRQPSLHVSLVSCANPWIIGRWSGPWLWIAKSWSLIPLSVLESLVHFYKSQQVTFHIGRVKTGNLYLLSDHRASWNAPASSKNYTSFAEYKNFVIQNLTTTTSARGESAWHRTSTRNTRKCKTIVVLASLRTN